MDPKWERVLWKKQNFPDNYVGKNFLRVHNKYVRISSLQAFYGCTLVTQEICCCLGLVAAFGGLTRKIIVPTDLMMLTAGVCAVAYFIARKDNFSTLCRKGSASIITGLLEELKVAMFAIVLCGFSSPLVKTLTESVATDTIEATTAGLLFLHLGFHNYGVSVSICNQTMSSNLGLFASVCLASRLDNHQEVFALTLVAVAVFTLMPSFREHCQEEFGKQGCLTLTVCVLLGSFYGICLYSPSLYYIFVISILLVNVVGPSAFLYLQHYRQNIYGPWDEALIDENLEIIDT